MWPVLILVPIAGWALRWAFDGAAIAAPAEAELTVERRKDEVLRAHEAARTEMRAAAATQRDCQTATAEAEKAAFSAFLDQTDALAERADDADRTEDVIHFARARRTHLQRATRSRT